MKYLSALNTTRNPDLLVPGAKFLKGNMYFKNFADSDDKKQEAQEEPGALDESDEIPEDDEFSKMKNQQARYFIDDNIAIKCRNCLQYGHRARDCPNDRKNFNCILCGKDTHDSF